MSFGPLEALVAYLAVCERRWEQQGSDELAVERAWRQLFGEPKPKPRAQLALHNWHRRLERVEFYEGNRYVIVLDGRTQILTAPRAGATNALEDVGLKAKALVGEVAGEAVKDLLRDFLRR